MKYSYLILSFVMLLLLSTLPVYALFGRVYYYAPYYPSDADSYHHVCYKIDGVTYNFILNHSTSDAWPCGNIKIVNTSIHIECVSTYDGAHAGKYTSCLPNSGKSCGIFDFKRDSAIGILANGWVDSQPSTSTSEIKNIDTGIYVYKEYKSSNWFLSHIPTNFYADNSPCPPAFITSTNPKNNSNLTPNLNNLEINTDIDAICRYSNISGLEFNEMALFTKTNSTTHSLAFQPISNNSIQSFFIKCNNEFGDISQEEYSLTLFGYNTTPVIASVAPLNGSQIYDAGSISATLITDKKAICKYSNTSGDNYSDMKLFSITNSTLHKLDIDAVDNATYNLYFKCQNIYDYVTPLEYYYTLFMNFSIPKLGLVNWPSNITINTTVNLTVNFSDVDGFSGNSCEVCVKRYDFGRQGGFMCIDHHVTDDNSSWTRDNLTTTYNSNNLSGSCFFSWNTTGLRDDYYNFTFRISDANNLTGNITGEIVLDKTAPKFLSHYPYDNGAFTINNTNSTNISVGVAFYYTVREWSSIENCSLIFDHKINATYKPVPQDYSIPKQGGIIIVDKYISKQFLVNLSTDIDGLQVYNWSIECTDVFGQKTETETRKFTLIVVGNFSGDTTDFTKVNLSKIENLTFEQTNSGKIRFSDIVDLGGVSNVNKHIRIGYNKIEINSTALPALNKSATLYLYNLTYSNAPKILKDNTTCPETVCKVVDYSNRTLIFNVTQFSIYTTEEAPASNNGGSDGESSGGNSGSSSSGGGGGSGGGSAAGFVCNMDWQCGDWSECINGWQTRECNFVKVPQHFQTEPCSEESKSPEIIKTCEVKKESVAVEEQNEINPPQETQTNTSQAPKNETALESVTGEVITEDKAKITKSNIIIVATILVVIVATYFMCRRKFSNSV